MAATPVSPLEFTCNATADRALACLFCCGTALLWCDEQERSNSARLDCALACLQGSCAFHRKDSSSCAQASSHHCFRDEVVFALTAQSDTNACARSEFSLRQKFISLSSLGPICQAFSIFSRVSIFFNQTGNFARFLGWVQFVRLFLFLVVRVTEQEIY
jgi:hypothetical protein